MFGLAATSASYIVVWRCVSLDSLVYLPCVVQRFELQRVDRNRSQRHIKPQTANPTVCASYGGVVVIVQVALVVLGSCVQPRCGCQCGDLVCDGGGMTVVAFQFAFVSGYRAWWMDGRVARGG